MDRFGPKPEIGPDGGTRLQTVSAGHLCWAIRQRSSFGPLGARVSLLCRSKRWPWLRLCNEQVGYVPRGLALGQRFVPLLFSASEIRDNPHIQDTISAIFLGGLGVKRKCWSVMLRRVSATCNAIPIKTPDRIHVWTEEDQTDVVGSDGGLNAGSP